MLNALRMLFVCVAALAFCWVPVVVGAYRRMRNGGRRWGGDRFHSLSEFVATEWCLWWGAFERLVKRGGE